MLHRVDGADVIAHRQVCEDCKYAEYRGEERIILPQKELLKLKRMCAHAHTPVHISIYMPKHKFCILNGFYKPQLEASG